MAEAEISTQQKASSEIVAFSNFMDKFKPQLALALPKHMTADRMARLALTSFSSSEQLRNCEPRTIASSVLVAAQLGLEPGVNGAGYLIPYKRTCTFVPGWKGLVDLVARSGRGTVYTGVIFRDQTYTFTDGARRDLVIHNETALEEADDITHAYAIGWVKDSMMPIIELWRVDKIRRHRDRLNKVGSSHYSYKHWEMYCRKIPLLQVLKYMPTSIEVAAAITVSHAAEEGRTVTMENGIIVDIEGNRQGENEIGGESTSGQSTVPTNAAGVKQPRSKKDAAAAGAAAGAGAGADQKKAEPASSQEPPPNFQDDRAQEQGINPETGEMFTEPESEQAVAAALSNARSQKELDAAADRVQNVTGEGAAERLGAIYHKRAAELKQQTATAPIQGASPPATDGYIKMVLAKANNATITEEEIFKHFEMTSWRGATVAMCNAILKWIANPS